jgi:hypothetical protein
MNRLRRATLFAFILTLAIKAGAQQPRVQSVLPWASGSQAWTARWTPTPACSLSKRSFTGEDFEQVKGVFGLRARKTEAAASAPW